MIENWKSRTDLPVPFMQEWETESILQCLSLFREPIGALEWGSGKSTGFFPEFMGDGSSWDSVEHDPEWGNSVSASLERRRRGDVRLHIVPNNEPYRTGVDDGDYTTFRDYVDYPARLGKMFDLILVDGRARVACMTAGWRLLGPDGIMILHDAQRLEYAPGIPGDAFILRITDPDMDSEGKISVLFMSRSESRIRALECVVRRLLPPSLLVEAGRSGTSGGVVVAGFHPHPDSGARKISEADRRVGPAAPLRMPGDDPMPIDPLHPRLRFLQVDTFYPRPIDLLYGRTPGLDAQPFGVQMEAIRRDGFAAIHTLAPYVGPAGYESAWVVGNCIPAQLQWARENGFSAFTRERWVHDIVRAQIEAFRPDVLYTTDAMVFDSDFIRSLKTRPRLVVGWQASDIPLDTDWSEFDLIVSPLAALRDAALRVGARDAADFLPGFPSWIHEEVRGIDPTEDVVFCGTWSTGQHAGRNRLLSHLAESSVTDSPPLGCAYYLSGQLETVPATVRPFLRGERFGIEMHRALRSGRIGLDAQGAIRLMGDRARDIAAGETANMRIFETTGTGLFLLAEHRSNLSRYFEVGTEIESFRDEREMVDKVRYYLAHPAEREAIALRGHERCMREHSMARRVMAFDALLRERLPAPTTTPAQVPEVEPEWIEVEATGDFSGIRETATHNRFGHWKVRLGPLSIRCHDLLSFYMAGKDIFLQGIYDFEAIRPAPRVLDGGGHIGLSALYVKSRYPDARITVFEPEDESHGLLLRNLAENGMRDVEVVKAGLYAHDGEISFGADGSDGSSIFSSEARTVIPVRRLSSWLTEEVDFLKLNIEGAETEVIREIEPHLHKVREIVIEYHGFPELGQKLHEILDTLDRNGFRYMIHDFDRETNAATKPPFRVKPETRFFLLIAAKRVASPAAATATAIRKGFPEGTGVPGGRTRPVSSQFGIDRGTAIDRAYIEHFLKSSATRIQGRVLEVGDDAYTRKYGTGVTRSDVLSRIPAPGATIVGDLATGENIPEAAFDCIILTQTLQMIFDVRGAVRNAVRALAPGGTLLVSVPGISQVSRYDMDRWGDYWRFTDRSLRDLFGEAVPAGNVVVESYGNVGVAKAFLDGYSLEELPDELLVDRDPDYPLILTAYVRKPFSVSAEDNLHSVAVTPGRATGDPLVLLYHRVADDPLDSQLLAVSPANFEAHLRELASNYRVVPLAMLLRDAFGGIFRPGTVALTFDDGYLDVLENGVPILEKYGLHATVFVTSGMVGSDREFWWDDLERIFLTGAPLPGTLDVTTPAGPQCWALDGPEGRVAAYEGLCAVLRNCDFDEIRADVDGLLAWAGMPSGGRKSHRVVDREQLRRLAASPSIEVGSHTVTHSRMSVLSPARQRDELVASRQRLGEWTGRDPSLFSYPYGTRADFDASTMRQAAEAGYTAGIANFAGVLKAGFDPFAVPRRLVRNWDGRAFADWLGSPDKDRLESEALRGRIGRILSFISSQGRSVSHGEGRR
jgi:FkbM family methyltransferase